MKKIFIISFLLMATGVVFSQFVQSALDSNFGNNGIVITLDTTTNSSEINALAIQTDDKIIATGYWNYIGEYHFQTARYNPDGTLDNSFGNGGIVSTDIGISDMPYSIVLQPDGKIIVAGNILANTSPPFEYHSTMVRYNTDGSMDNSFGTGGIVITIVDPSSDGIFFIALQQDGRIVAGGFAGYQFLLMRYNNDGTLDNSFGSGGIVLTSIEAKSYIHSIVIQPDSKILVAGTTEDIISNQKFALARYNTDGTMDTNFGTGGKVVTDLDSFSYEVSHSLALQADYKIVVAGFSGDNCALVRYNTNGILDNSFGIDGKVVTDSFPGANDLAIQSDGKIIVSGNVVISDYNYGYSLTRFNTDGTPDSSFGIGGNIKLDIRTGNDYSQCLTLQLDEKIIIAGSSRDSSTSPANFTLVRFTSDLTDINDIVSSLPYWKIYPNPSKENIKIEIAKEVIVETIQLHDLNGKLIKVFLPKDMLLNITDIRQGQYLLSITTDKGIFTEKIIKQ